MALMHLGHLTPHPLSLTIIQVPPSIVQPAMASSLRAYVLSSLFFSLAWGQTTHIVTVGAEGSFYEPATVSVALNDTVRFIFEGPLHGVIQCAVDNPCVPLPGGFSSGFAGRGDDFSMPAPVWDLQITNVSHPLWFYCANTKPVSHCASGMVGAINPPSIQAYNQFRDRAKAVTTTALVGPSVVTNAPDAFATNSPLPTPSSSSTTSSSLTPTPAPINPSLVSPSSSATSEPTHSSHEPAIIGGSVGGGVFVIIVIVLAFVVLCRKRRKAKRGSRDFFRYKAESPELGSSNGVFTPVKMISSPSSSPSAALLRMTDPPLIKASEGQ
ncbi:hypothetical protein BDZ94DRAFT_783447 [Collybia nuda]|uniref:Extracellular serine-rich protein n=1 Tax=Collybia nuda TaxID=64659 RepID=A0A9P5YIT5_9AGAR|nr:hypothetical protein BDZ94DRAFT_783447 [Collybia nuda]